MNKCQNCLFFRGGYCHQDGMQVYSVAPWSVCENYQACDEASLRERMEDEEGGAE